MPNKVLPLNLAQTKKPETNVKKKALTFMLQKTITSSAISAPSHFSNY
jgi:hypothetical protein